jgi:hypothetical protein
MSARKVVTIKGCAFPSSVTGSTSTRAQTLILSGLTRVADDIGAVSDHLTDSVMATLDADLSERDIFIADFTALRSAVWEGIARGGIARLKDR